MESKVSEFRLATFAESTQKTYSSYLKSYLQFCCQYDIVPVPVEPINIARYIAFLSFRLSASSISKYLTVIRLLHIESGFANPLENNWLIKSVIRGMQRTKGTTVNKKMPITPNILLKIKGVINLSLQMDVNFWAACLVGFFGMLRRSNFLPQNKNSFDSSKHLRRMDVIKVPNGFVLKIRWSKTIQNKERVHWVPIPDLGDHPLCPSRALANALQYSQAAPPSGPVFVTFGKDGFVPLTANTFVAKLKQLLSAVGVSPSQYAGHSLRRGGASWALQVGIPKEIIMIMGDWKSDAVFQYFSLSLPVKMSYYKTFGSCLPSSL